MADRAKRNAQRRRQRRRRAVVFGTAGALVAAGAGTAWALSGSAGPSYRLASVQRGDITQTVDADGSLTAKDSSTVSFAAEGTVDSLRVSVGDHVRAGQTLATLGPADLQTAVTSARATLAQARQRLADDVQAQLTGSSSSSPSSPSAGAPTAANSRSADGASSTRLTSPQPTKQSGGNAGGTQSVRAAQQAVEAAQRALDDAIARVSSDVDAAAAACDSTTAQPTTDTVTADADGTVSGTVGDAPLVAVLLDTSTSSPNPQTIAAGGSYSFGGLSAGQSYRVVLVPQSDNAGCSAALGTLQKDHSSTANGASVVSTDVALRAAIRNLDDAVAALSSGASTSSGSTGNGSTGNGSTGNGSSGGARKSTSATQTGSVPSSSAKSSPSGSSTPNSSATTVTAAQIAADTQAIDAANAELAVAKHDVGEAELTAPISGTVGAVNITKGETVAASSTSATITVVGSGALSADLSIGLADIDLVKVGQHAQVTVDGRSEPLAATVSYVGGTNTADSTGSSSTYLVTVSLARADASLFDGMGATVAIDVGSARNALSVPISAVHTTGTLHTVTVYAAGKTTGQRVTLGVEGEDRVQITSGVTAGDEVVLAELAKSIPSSNSDSRLGGNGSFNRLTSGGGGPVFKGGPPR